MSSKVAVCRGEEELVRRGNGDAIACAQLQSQLSHLMLSTNISKTPVAPANRRPSGRKIFSLPPLRLSIDLTSQTDPCPRYSQKTLAGGSTNRMRSRHVDVFLSHLSTLGLLLPALDLDCGRELAAAPELEAPPGRWIRDDSLVAICCPDENS